MADVVRARNWLIYGRSGTGKTTLASTFPGPALLIDVRDEGTDSVSDVKGLKVADMETWDDLEDIYWYLYENPDEFKTVIVDTVTQAQQLMVEQVAAGKNLRSKNPGDWGTLTKQDWGTIASELKSWVIRMRDLPAEVVFIAQERTFDLGDEEDVDGQIDPEVGPRLSPSVKDHLCAAVSMIGHTFIREKVVKKKIKGKEVERSKKEYCIRLGPNPYYITKLRKPRSSELPEFLENPTYEEFITIIKGE